MEIRKELIDELIATSEGSLIGPDGFVKELTKMLVERMLAGEMNHHLGHQKHDPDGDGSGNDHTLEETFSPMYVSWQFVPILIRSMKTGLKRLPARF